MYWDDEDEIRFEARRIAKKPEAGQLKRLYYPPKPRVFVRDPFTLAPGSDVILDVECFRNYFEVGFKHVETGQYFYAEQTIDQWFPTDLVRRALWHFRTFGFNSRNYDLPMLEAAIQGASCSELKDLSDEIIKENKRIFNRNSPYNHVDLIEVAPLEGSLKLYAARLHCERMQENPIDEAAILSPQDMADVLEYNFNDLDNTELLLMEPQYGLMPHIQLRERLGAEIKEDIRSKSDAQVGEAFINAKLREYTGRFPKKPEFEDDFEFYYQPPPWVNFGTPQLQRALEIVRSVPFKLDAGGAPVMPEALSKLSFKLGGCTYKMGMGGLHSSEKTTAHKADDETDLIDRDVVSFYPWLIINSGFFPKHLGEIFIEIFRDDLVLRRMELKKLKDKLEAGLKIAINGIFGKLGSVYSTIFSPNLLIQVTITGQLAILMLIEMIEQAGIPVVSANTDGAIIKCPKRMGNVLGNVIAMWEAITNLQTEETQYAAVYSRDVNNYIAVKKDGECKAKGTYSERGSAQNSTLSKNPESLICSDAVKALLSKGTDVEDTIRSCRDIRRFVTVRNVRGGAHKDGYFLGKTIRWYYAKGVRGEINYVMSGNKVPNSEGAKPYMELSPDFPEDVNHEYYIRKAYDMLRDIGYYGNKPVQMDMF